MARTDISGAAVISAPGGYSATGAAIALQAADAVNNNQVTMGGNDLLIAQNTGISAHTVTISSVADKYGRTGDVAAQSLAAGEIRILGPFPPDGWRQTDGKLYLAANHAEVKFGVIRL